MKKRFYVYFKEFGINKNAADVVKVMATHPMDPGYFPNP